MTFPGVLRAGAMTCDVATLALPKSPDMKGQSERTARPTVSMARWKKLTTWGQQR